MKIKKLEITGFKSFHEKTQIEFPPGISAIVGPNGCGKSNIVDAIKWVMGEQSVKQLRGKSMDDIIFAGSNGAAPLNMAEVSLTILNENGSAPEELKEFHEIMITRRLYRSGERSYLINKRPCRLKDINNIFSGNGSASKSYSVIQQGTIGLITEAGPEERKLLIEEAAGISRFKTRKTEALRKVDKTNQNIARINDIIIEIERQIKGLKRQANKAEQYKNQKEDIKRLDIILAVRYYNDFTIDIDKSETLLKELKDKDIGHFSKISKLDSAIENIKLKHLQKNQKISELNAGQFELQRKIDKMENDIGHLRKDIENLKTQSTEHEKNLFEIEGKNKKIINEINEIKNINIEKNNEAGSLKQRLHQEKDASQTTKNELVKINEEIENHKTNLISLVSDEAKYKNILENANINKEKINRSLKRKDEEEFVAETKVREEVKIIEENKHLTKTLNKNIYNIDEQIKTTSENLKAKNNDLNAAIKQIQSMKIDNNKAISEYKTLKKMEGSYEWYKSGVKAIMQSNTFKKSQENKEDNTSCFNSSDKIIGLLSDVIEPEPSFEAATEAALGESLQYIIVDNQDIGVQLINFLEKNKAGRCGLIPLSMIKQSKGSDLKTENSSNNILNHIKVKSGFEKIINVLLSHTLIADNLKDAINISGNNEKFKSIVTKDGDIVTNKGIIIGGSKENFSQIFEKKNRIKELETHISKFESSLEVKYIYQKDLESKIREFESNLQKITQEKNNFEQKKLNTEKNLYKAQENHKHLCRLLEVVNLEKDRLFGEEQDIDEELHTHDIKIKEIESSIEYTQNKIVETKENAGSVLYEMERFNQKIIDLNLRITTLSAELENNSNTLKRLSTFHDDSKKQAAQLRLDIRSKNQTHLESENKLEKFKNLISTDYDSLTCMEKIIKETKTEYQNLESILNNHNNTISDIKNKREEVLSKTHMLEIELSQKHLKRENILNGIVERQNKTIEELKKEFYTSSNPSLNYSKIYSNINSDQLEDELSDLKKRISKINDINLNAINEYNQLKNRYSFLCEQRDDLVSALEDLNEVIKKINIITKNKFLTAYNMINEKLSIIFPRLFEEGSAKLVLTDPDNPLETGVEFTILLPGKKLSRLSLLSGGEKALSAIALVFSIFLIKPVNFCLMDEIDAALDDANVFRFNDLLKIIGEKSQILMISHNKNSMKLADNLFGITMEKKGISKIVSVDLANA